MKLLRATPWFESYLTEGEEGYFLHHRYGGAPEQVSPNFIDRVDREGDWFTFDENFDSLEALEVFVESKVPKRSITLNDLPASLLLAKTVLSKLKALKELTPPIRLLIESLLESPTVAQEPSVKQELKEILAR